MSTNGIATARNQFLTVVAGALSRQTIQTAAELTEVAKVAATGVASQHAKVRAEDLIQSMPAAWTADPGSSSTRDLASAFLRIAQPILGVDAGKLAALTQQSLGAAQRAGVMAAIEQAAEAWKKPSAIESMGIHLEAANVETLSRLVNEVLRDPNFHAAMGGPKYARFFTDHVADEAAAVLRQLVGAIEDARNPRPKAQVLAGGRPVRDSAELDFVELARRPKATTGRELARAIASVCLLRRAIDEVGLRSALIGQPANFLCGRVPYGDQVPLTVRVVGEEVAFGIAIDVGELRQYQPVPVDEATFSSRFATYMDKLAAEKLALFKQGVPLAIACDKGVTFA